MTKLANVVRDNILKMTPYCVGDQEDNGLLKLNSNENPYPPAQFIIDSIFKEIKENRLNIYPDNQANLVKNAASKVFNVGFNNLIITNGSTPLLQTIFCTLLDTDDSVVVLTPTFGIYEKLILIQNSRIFKIPYNDDGSLPLNRILQCRAKLIVLANPNTPTGLAISPNRVEQFLLKTNSTVLIDEAYGDFSNNSATSLIKKFNNLIIVRTLSKAHSLAGMRIGYGLSSSDIIDNLYKVLPICNVNRLSQVVATSVFENWTYFEKQIQEIISTREFTIAKLREIGLCALSSSTNFVFIKMNKSLMPAHQVSKELKDRGVLVRYFSDDNVEGIRVTIGTPQNMIFFMKAITDIICKCKF